MDLNELVNYIILLGGLIGAIKVIILPILNSTKWFKGKIKSSKANLIESSVKEAMEDINPKIDNLDKKIESINEKVASIDKQNKVQNEKLKELEASIGKVADGTRDSLRAEMLKIYYKYLPYSMIPSFDRQAFMEMYQSYTILGGNTFIHDIKPILESWKVVEKQSDIPDFKYG